jgi:hypothetical protein
VHFSGSQARYPAGRLGDGLRPPYLLVPPGLPLCQLLQFGEHPTTHAHLMEDPVFFPDEVVWRPDLGKFPVVEHDKPIVVDDSPEPVSHYKQRNKIKLPFGKEGGQVEKTHLSVTKSSETHRESHVVSANPWQSRC